MATKRAAIFDADGTLVDADRDSEEDEQLVTAHHAHLCKLVNELGIQITARGRERAARVDVTAAQASTARECTSGDPVRQA